MNEDHLQYIAFQILKGLDFLHKQKIIHRDIKPANILVNQKCEVKLADFGQAITLKTLNQEEGSFRYQKQILSSYIATRWYRAPEIVFEQLAEQGYDQKVDIWALGCQIAEIKLKKPIFPGESNHDQFKRIVDLINTTQDLKKYNKEYRLQYMNEEKSYILDNIPKLKKRQKIQNLFQTSQKQFRNFIRKCLTFDKNSRPSAEELLNHQFVSH